MQRILSILLTMVLGLGPTLAATPVSALTALTAGWGASRIESSLPACCRKHGAHHCAQSRQAAPQTAGTETTLSASSCCPCWPGTLISSATEDAAVVFAAAHAHEDTAQQVVLASSTSASEFSSRRTWPKRGPPSQTIL